MYHHLIQDNSVLYPSGLDKRREGGGGGVGGECGSDPMTNPPVDCGPSGSRVTGMQTNQGIPSRIPTLRSRNQLHVQFDPADLESSKGSCLTLEGSAKGSMLETDSGYLTTLGSLGHKQER